MKNIQLEQVAQSQEGAHLDGSDGEGDLPPAINVRVQDTKNVLELLRDDQRLRCRGKQSESHTATCIFCRDHAVIHIHVYKLHAAYITRIFKC